MSVENQDISLDNFEKVEVAKAKALGRLGDKKADLEKKKEIVMASMQGVSEAGTGILGIIKAAVIVFVISTGFAILNALESSISEVDAKLYIIKQANSMEDIEDNLDG